MVRLIMFGMPFNDVFEKCYSGLAFRCIERLIMFIGQCVYSHFNRKLTVCDF